ncbi:helix-turn-helix transcriptional regulator [Haematospirillum jordaniae]|nr:helix-turn-helix transcriptional regulator [Haematospirillum jordaniae]NKD44605.1 helix-turn-helix transcriptional regulator [Haematospirillum jordaniae]NKD57625.1 helix-turn-helix transcriptional regulator [Haematospirillum jordaniae]NKD59195.1 helix-turn-helix transcriptional regulator [Haematospirillum jordaniae]NKD67333.1 helix-turn-helix transcriptional regulator [Haematospirillum jordaniae]NKD79526.1 helix-turn-helix transcriptional regulator [Haematospirillum jordaniae]
MKTENSYGYGEGQPNPVDVHVGARVRFCRTVQRISQTTLADALGLTFQQIQKYERGTNRISASRLWDISQALGVPVTYFFDDLPDALSRDEIHQQEAVPELSRESVALLIAYSKIDKKSVRRRVFDLTRVLAEIQQGTELETPKAHRETKRRTG